MKFSLIGFDVRIWPWERLSVEAGEWDIHEEAYANLIHRFGLKENEYQLLEIVDADRLNEVCSFLGETQDCNLVAVELPAEVVKAMDERYGFNTSSVHLDLSGFISRGLDVCDYDGFFSALDHMQVSPEGTGLLPVSQIDEACRLVELANKLVPEHSPHSVAKVSTLK